MQYVQDEVERSRRAGYKQLEDLSHNFERSLRSVLADRVKTLKSISATMDQSAVPASGVVVTTGGNLVNSLGPSIQLQQVEALGDNRKNALTGVVSRGSPKGLAALQPTHNVNQTFDKMLSPDMVQRNLSGSGIQSFRSSSIVRSKVPNVGPTSATPFRLKDEIERRLDKVRTEEDIESFVQFMLIVSSQAYQGELSAAKMRSIQDDKLSDRLGQCFAVLRNSDNFKEQNYTLLRTRNNHKFGHCNKKVQGSIARINSRNQLLFETVLKTQEMTEIAKYEATLSKLN